MFLLSRKIKALGVKMVLSGEGSDEVLGGYLYFHKAPSKEEFHRETCRKLKALHMYDCVRAKKATSAWGLEVRVPFLDKEFLDVAMSIDPQYKMIRKRDRRIEKWVIRRAFDDEERPYLPKHILYRQKEQFSDGVGYSWIDGLKAHAERMHILYRQKEQFSDGVGYSWIDGLKAHAERMVSDQVMANAPNVFTYLPPQTKEALFYRRIFEKHFPQSSWRSTSPSALLRSARLTVPGGPSRSARLTVPGGPSRSARLTVPGGPSVACSTAAGAALIVPPSPQPPFPFCYSALLVTLSLESPVLPVARRQVQHGMLPGETTWTPLAVLLWVCMLLLLKPEVHSFQSTAAGAALDAAWQWQGNIDPSGRAALAVLLWPCCSGRAALAVHDSYR
ncbi:unnamed protein product [Closterium sp. Naga37s-1]|nr:unnamed protein product [Closterium sp. Naga37s-1]